MNSSARLFQCKERTLRIVADMERSFCEWLGIDLYMYTSTELARSTVDTRVDSRRPIISPDIALSSRVSRSTAQW